VDNLKASLRERLRALTVLHGAPGFEQPVVAYLREAFLPLADSVEIDPMGNLYAVRRGRGEAPRLMLSAHSDEIGGIVKSIEPGGFLRFERLGGTMPLLLVAREVWVNGRLGVVGVRSGHLMKAAGEVRVPATDELYIDVGARSADEVSRLGISVGDSITYHSPLIELPDSDLVIGKAIDNRLGCSVLLQTLAELQGSTPAGDVVVVIAVQEEVGSRGARVAARRAAPDYAIVVDTFMAGDTPDVQFYTQMPAGIGRGPVFLLASGDAVLGQLIHPAMKRWMTTTAKRIGVPYQLATMVGISFTDSSVVHLAREGIPTGGLGLARRYSHSPVEMADLNDAAHAVCFLRAFVEDMVQHKDIGFLGE
jgi:putative aminopeptidase